jgi:hypothetical protein
LFSAELLWCLVFVQKSDFQEKILENTTKILFCQNTHGARRRDEEGLWPGLTTRERGPALAAPTCGEAASAIASTPSSTYIYPLT